MRIKNVLLGASAAFMMASLVAAEGLIEIKDPYARTSRPNAPTGAAFMVLMNNGETEDRLIAAKSDIAKRVELHTHKEDGNGVMTMMEIEAIVIPAGGTHAMKRGGDHVMFMGLNESLEQGDTVSVTLVFENAGEVQVEIPVDLDRKPDASAHGGHSSDG